MQGHLPQQRRDPLLALARQQFPNRRRQIAHRGIQANALAHKALRSRFSAIRPAASIYERRREWDIEAMFPDYKTRGFNLEDSQIERTDRLDQLVLVLSLALYWAVSTGMWDAMENKTPAEKKRRRRAAKTSHAA